MPIFVYESDYCGKVNKVNFLTQTFRPSMKGTRNQPSNNQNLILSFNLIFINQNLYPCFNPVTIKHSILNFSINLTDMTYVTLQNIFNFPVSTIVDLQQYFACYVTHIILSGFNPTYKSRGFLAHIMENCHYTFWHHVFSNWPEISMKPPLLFQICENKHINY